MRANKKIIINKWLLTSWIFSAISVLLFLVTPSSLNEAIYKNKIYPAIRWLLNHTFGLLPFPAFYIVFPALFILLFYILIRQLIAKKHAQAILNTLSYLVFIFCTFLWLWGYNYNNNDLIPQPSLDEIVIKKVNVLQTFERAQKLRNRLDDNITSHKWNMQTYEFILDSGQVWLNQANALLHQEPAQTSKGFRHWFSGGLLRWAVVGMYFPFTGESTIDKALHGIRLPSTMLHEWAHSMGHTHEGDCNLLAYLAAQYSNHTFIRYSAEIERLREELIFVAIQNPQLYQELKSALPLSIEEDLDSIRNHHAKYRGKTNELGNWFNDQYLKTLSSENGVDEYWLWVVKLQQIEALYPNL